MIVLSSADFFFKKFTHDRFESVKIMADVTGPDLSQNCLQKVVSRRKKSAQSKNEVTMCMVLLAAKTLKKLRTSKG